VTTSHNFIERQIDERDSVLMTLIELTWDSISVFLWFSAVWTTYTVARLG
jgi:hypothetical protein